MGRQLPCHNGYAICTLRKTVVEKRGPGGVACTETLARRPNMAGQRNVRIMTSNVHRCLGADGAISPARIAEVIVRYQPDVVALQELDVGRARTGHADQPEMIARAVQMRHEFFPAIEAAHERYGDAIL